MFSLSRTLVRDQLLNIKRGSGPLNVMASLLAMVIGMTSSTLIESSVRCSLLARASKLVKQIARKDRKIHLIFLNIFLSAPINSREPFMKLFVFKDVSNVHPITRIAKL